MEKWKAIEGFVGRYEVSSLGRVRSLACPRSGSKFSHKKTERIMSPSYNKANGYYSLVLMKDGKRHQFYIHRLVAVAFVQNRDGLPCVNHKDENKRNNRADNLEWCSQLENVRYGTGIQRRVENTATSKKGRCYPKKISQYTLDGKLVATYRSSEEAARAVGGNGSNIRTCARHDRGVKQSNGFVWRYEDEPF